VKPGVIVPCTADALAGLAFAMVTLFLGWTVGGQSTLGRVDPALVLPLLLVTAGPLSLWLRRRAAQTHFAVMIWAVITLLFGQGALMAWVGHGFSVMQLLLVSFGTAVAIALSYLLWSQQKWAGRLIKAGVAMVLTFAWFIGSHALLSALYSVPIPSSARSSVTMMTSLPLRWAGGGDLKAVLDHGPSSAPALAVIERVFSVDLVDSLVDPPFASPSVLLLAHPRALAPEELVAIDAHVRGGGRAVILADALSGWPTDYPIGNPRNPPVTSLLTPLLDHWGITLDAAPSGETQATKVWQGGYRLSLFSAGRFSRLPKACHAFAQRRIADCSIGQGHVWLVGDADLLFAPLWQPLVAGAAHLNRADNMAWLIYQLDEKAELGRPWLRPVWIQ
jgi:hypothetical protein